MALGRPQLELGVPRRPHLQQRIVAPIVELDARDGLRVASVEVLGEPQDGRQRPNGLAPFPAQIPEA